MDGKPLPPDLKQRIIERGCSYLVAVGRALDPPETEENPALRRSPQAPPGEGRATREPFGVLARFRRAASQLLGL